VKSWKPAAAKHASASTGAGQIAAAVAHRPSRDTVFGDTELQ
jgi:hypothetical protein